jgi:hypothetical protein
MTNKLLAAGLAALAMATVPTISHAHGSMQPQHGGMVRMSGETLIELVSTPKGVDVYLTEEDEPVVAANYTAKLTQTAGTAKTEAVLKSAGANKLTVAGFKTVKGAKLVVALVDKSGAKIFATFQVN